jgi:Zn-dependent M28 family amino/carboxypeptidase
MLATDEAGLKREEEKFTAKAKGAANETVQPINSRAVAAFKISLVRTVADAYNVVAILEGTDAGLKNEAIVIGAHYDHLGRGGAGSLAVNSKEVHYGADDNASGVSAMLELARQFSQEKRNKRTIIFIAFGGEEEGLLGSKFYVNNPAFPINKTVAMINLDMVGRLQNDENGFGKLTIGGIGTANEWRELVLRIAINMPTLGMFQTSASKNKTAETSNSSQVATLPPETEIKIISPSKIEKGFNPQLNEDGFGPSDHSSFYAQKIPVLFFFTGTHADYHKPTDTAEKINYQGLLKITNYVGEIVKAIDVSPNKPTYAVAKSSGAMGGRTGFNVSLGTVPSYSESTDGMTLDAVRDDSPAQKRD